MEKKFLSPEELNEFQTLKNNYDTIIFELGEIELEMIELQNKKDKIKINIESLKKHDKMLGTQLENKYGPIMINNITGEITPLEKN